MSYDKEKLFKKISIIKKCINNLDELSNLKPKEFVSDFRYYDSAKYNLQIAIEAMIDIGNHIISRMGLEPPKTYADTFEILGKHDIVMQNMVNTYKQMAKFRNRIVHFYDDVNESEVYNILQNNINDFNKFILSIGNFLEQENK
jgi:uncharacterized protein YutE (UPF0331/DUF86 family)